jgi:hypothetical protein
MSDEPYQDRDWRGYIWWCGDEWCDCTMPIIEKVKPLSAFGRFVRRETVWKGTFHSGASADESREQERELEDAWSRRESLSLATQETDPE